MPSRGHQTPPDSHGQRDPPRSPSAPPGLPAPPPRRPRGTGLPRSRWRKRARCPHPGDLAAFPGFAPAPAPAQHPPAGRGERAVPGRVVGLGRAGRSRTGTHRCPGPRQAVLLPAESMKGLEGGVQAAAAWQILGNCHVDFGLLQCPAQGLLPVQHQGFGECFPGLWDGTAVPQLRWQHRGAKRDLRGNTPGVAAPLKPDPHSGRARRSWCH